jgi:hypothetical protein
VGTCLFVKALSSNGCVYSLIKICLFRNCQPVTGLRATISSSRQLIIHPDKIRSKLYFRFSLPHTWQSATEMIILASIGWVSLYMQVVYVLKGRSNCKPTLRVPIPDAEQSQAETLSIFPQKPRFKPGTLSAACHRPKLLLLVGHQCLNVVHVPNILSISEADTLRWYFVSCYKMTLMHPNLIVDLVSSGISLTSFYLAQFPYEYCREQQWELALLTSWLAFQLKIRH